MPIIESFRGVRPVILPIPESPNSRPQELAQPQRLADIPEFAAIAKPRHKAVLNLLDNAMSGLTFDQKRKLFIYYAWQHETDSSKLPTVLGLPSSLVTSAVDEVATSLETRYERLLGMTDIVMQMKNEKKDTEAAMVNEFDYWVYKEDTKLGENPEKLANRIPPEFAAASLSDAERINAVLFSLEKSECYKIASKRIRDHQKMHPVPAVVKPREAVEDRLLTLSEIVQKIQEKTGQTVTISEFDYWVYRVWFEAVESPKSLAHHIPNEFQLNGLPLKSRLNKIHAASTRLAAHGVISMSFPERAQQLRRDRMSAVIAERVTMPSREELAQEFGVTISCIKSDLSAMRRAKEISRGRMIRTRRVNDRLISQINKAILKCEEDGRSYAKGEIGPYEIALQLDMDRVLVSNLINSRRNRTRFPRRENPLMGREGFREAYKGKIRQIVGQNPEFSLSQVYSSLKELDPKMPFAKATIQRMRMEVLKETQGVQESERVLAEDVSQTVV